MGIETMRKEFEAWANGHYLLSELNWGFKDAEYVEPELQYAWEAWQASRAALVIELPADDGMDGHLWAPDVAKAIEAAGVRVKP